MGLFFMNETFEANAAILRRRWPKLLERLLQEDLSALQQSTDLVTGRAGTLRVGSIQLTSRYDRRGEASLQAASVPRGATCVSLYGCGLGDVQGVLLERSELHTLNVWILNAGLFALVLHLVDQSAWLNNPRVELALASREKGLLRPFVALPAELALADEENARIRDLLVMELQRDFVNRKFDPRAAQWQERLSSNLELLRQDADVAELFASERGREFFVVATGPSLEGHLDRLRAIRARADRPFFVAVDTALLPLVRNGIVPDAVVSIDPDVAIGHFPLEDTEQTALIYFPSVSNAVISAWRGPRYAAYSGGKLFDEIRRRIGKAQLYANGSVIHPAVDLAVRMGACSVTLFGADFSFPGDKSYAFWKDGVLGGNQATAKHWVLNGHGERVKTQLNFRSYLYGLVDYIATHPDVVFFNTSRDGAHIEGARFHPEFVSG